MTLTIILSIATCLGLIAVVLLKPNMTIGSHTVDLSWVEALLGAVLFIVLGCISPKEVLMGITASGAVNPIKILVLFISMTMLSVYLDSIGFFSYLAGMVMYRTKGSRKSLFFILYILVSVLTVFTSNDIIILTFTPFICYFTKSARIDPLPYLIAEFVAANTWSMALIIGNPTNIYLATGASIGFVEYMLNMLLPTVCGALTAMLLLFLIFRKELSRPMTPHPHAVEKPDRVGLLIGLVHLGGCTACLVVSSYVGLEMWIITFFFALSLFITTLISSLIRRKKPVELTECLRRAPWQLIPFVLSMFVMVLALNRYGVTEMVASALDHLSGTALVKDGHSGESLLVSVRYGISSVLAANFMNNIPMSVFYSDVLNKAQLGLSVYGAEPALKLSECATYATIAGSNIGAILTPVGALAGIMWSQMLKKNHVTFKFSNYVKCGMTIGIPSMLVTSLVIWLMVG